MTYQEIKQMQATSIVLNCISIFNNHYACSKEAVDDKEFCCAKYHFRSAVFYLNRAHKIASFYNLTDTMNYCIKYARELDVYFPSRND